jgi:hypothetical protein
MSHSLFLVCNLLLVTLTLASINPGEEDNNTRSIIILYTNVDKSLDSGANSLPSEHHQHNVQNQQQYFSYYYS